MAPRQQEHAHSRAQLGAAEPRTHRPASRPSPLPPPLLPRRYTTQNRRSLFGAVVLRFPPALQPAVYMLMHQVGGVLGAALACLPCMCAARDSTRPRLPPPVTLQALTLAATSFNMLWCAACGGCGRLSGLEAGCSTLPAAPGHGCAAPAAWSHPHTFCTVAQLPCRWSNYWACTAFLLAIFLCSAW